MKLVFESSVLAKILADVASVAAQRNTLPILSNVLLKAQGIIPIQGTTRTTRSKITIAATDLEIGMVMEVEGEVEEDGEITIPAKKLLDIVREASPDDKVTIETLSSDRIAIEYGTAKFKIAGLASDEFPPVPSISDGGVKIKGEKLCTLLRKVVSGASTEEIRYFLNGVYVIIERFKDISTDGSITAVGTDGKRLMVATQITGGAITKKITGIIPVKAVKKIVSMFDHADMIDVNLLESELVIGGEGIVFITRLIEGEYPDYQAVINPVKNNDLVLDLDKESFISVIKRVSLLANPKTPSVRLEAVEGVLTITSSTPDLGEAVECLPVDYSDASIIISLNARYLLDILQSVTGKVTLKFRDSLSPVLVLDNDDIGFIGVIMPMRL